MPHASRLDATGRGLVRCGLAAVLFGASAPAASRLVRRLDAFSLAGLLYLGAAAGVLPFVVRLHADRMAIRRAAPRLAMAVFFGGMLGPVLLAAGLARTAASTASLMLNLELVFTSIVAFLLFREHLGRRVMVGIAFVFIASVTMAWTGPATVQIGSLLVAGACLCWAVDNCVTAALDQLAPVHITFAKGVVAGSVNVALGIALHHGPAPWPALAALLVGSIGYGASITLWVSGARLVGAARGQLVFAAAPFVGAVISWTVLGENLSARQMIALAVAAIGVTFVVRSAHEHLHEHPPIEHDHEHSHDDRHHDHHHEGLEDAVVHSHQHQHARTLIHSHPHVPDVHHRHVHD